MHGNKASANGGALSVGTGATVRVSQSVAKRNVAGGSGGFVQLPGVMSATLRGVDATGNEAGTTGGGAAVVDSTRIVDSTRSTVTLTNSTIHGNKAGDSGAGIFVENSEMDVSGAALLKNSARRGNGGGAATSGENTNLAFSDTQCVPVDVLLDWTAAGNGCPPDTNHGCMFKINYAVTTCRTEAAGGVDCNGCSCNDA